VPNPLAKRIAFWKDIYYGWTRKGVASFITISTVVLVFRDLFVAPAHKDFSFFKYIPQWPWYSWLIVGLIGLLLLTLESSYNKSQRDRMAIRGHLRTRLKDRDARHKADLLSAQVQSLNQPLSTVEGVPVSLPIIDEPVSHLEPNIVLEQPEVLDVYTDERDGVLVEGTPRGRELEMMLAHLANYRNLVREFKPVGVAKNTTGRAIYRQYESVAPISKERIAWLSQTHPRVVFEPNDIRKLVLALQDSKDRVFVVQRELSGRGSETRYTPLADGLYSVWVSVIDEANGHVYDKREFILDVDRPGKLKVTLQEASLWRSYRLKDFHEKLSLLKDSYKATVTAPDTDAAENAATLAKVFDRDMLKCKEFVAQHFNSDKANRLGLSISENDARPTFAKRLLQPRGIVDQMTLFLDRLSDLRVNG
jgi:hypothetical protein